MVLNKLLGWCEAYLLFPLVCNLIYFASSSKILILSYTMQKKVNALIDIKLEKFKNLPEETNFFWWEISSGTLKFDRIENEVWFSFIHMPFFISMNWIDR